jgi:hypothetical protein
LLPARRNFRQVIGEAYATYRYKGFLTAERPTYASAITKE